MSFQTILDISQTITVNNRRMVGQQYSRSGQVRTALYVTSVPWVFTVKPHSFLYYPQVRDVIQTIDNLDRQTAATITFSSTNLHFGFALVSLFLLRLRMPSSSQSNEACRILWRISSCLTYIVDVCLRWLNGSRI